MAGSRADHQSEREKQLEAENERLRLQNALLREELFLARHRLFGRKTEAAVLRNLPLFDELPIGIVEKPTEPQPYDQAAHKRARKVGRKPLSPDLPREDIVHDLAEDEKQCACGCTMVRIGEETCEKLAFIPRRYYVERHIRPKYACHACEGSGDEERAAVRIAPVPPSIIPRSIATPSLLAALLTSKYCDHLPFYRQELIFERDGIDLSRQDMSNWAIRVGMQCESLVNLLETHLLRQAFIQMDETTLQVLGEPERSATAKSYMWLARGGPPGKQAIVYRYQPTRSAKHPATLLADYEGHIQTDGYEAYETALRGKNIVHVGCWAHARRKFDEAAKASKTPGLAQEGLAVLRKLYAIEKALRPQLDCAIMSPEEFVAKRKELVAPVLEEIQGWLKSQAERILPSSLIGKAIQYTIGQWDKLVRYLDRAEITPDNNACENAIRPFVLGRKNWLFSGSPTGAQASCNIYTLIETAKANGLEPWAYLKKIFSELPVTPSDKIANLLPFA
jgi:transposase